MWKWSLMRNAHVNLLHILLFTAIGIGLIYSIDFIFRKIKNKTK
jgi:preprotein translocase subunit SecE